MGFTIEVIKVIFCVRWLSPVSITWRNSGRSTKKPTTKRSTTVIIILLIKILDAVAWSSHSSVPTVDELGARSFAKKPHQSQAAHRNRYTEAATAHRTESTSKIIYSSIRGDVVSDKVMTYDDIISAYFYPFRPRRTQTIQRSTDKTTFAGCICCFYYYCCCCVF